jgi:uncharacterized OB-fold protein
LVTLDEGPRICTNLIGIDPRSIQPNMRVEVFFQPLDNGNLVLPFFKPVAA